MSVKRFYWETPSEYGWAAEHPEGDLVWWKDYEKLEADYARLKAKVERLTKAGIAMGTALPDTDEANAAYSMFERVVKS